MTSPNEFFSAIRGRLIVSCQASKGDAFRDSPSIGRFARAAVDGGAGGIRADSPEDIRAIRAAVDVPVIGIQKRYMEDGRILITPTFEDARALVEAGASAIALDCTVRGQRHGSFDVVRRIREELRVPVMADIATLEEALAAEAAGVDMAGSTLRGYTDETSEVDVFQPGFITSLVERLRIPVIAEGRVNTPREAAAALRAGAWAVIVGTAITRPHDITRWFVEAMSPAPDCVVAIDMGGTNTKSGIVTAEGRLLEERSTPTPFSAGRGALLEHLRRITAGALEDAGRIGRKP
ncbi:MAG: putative N-acetylmannosamine-6-phosphate 2-epimerase, partial [Acidobacteria bacterium]|nr:putative N-acetylmannosamine-6-phosphate 2-epimerase [Acidobacteriota bacterium]